MQNKDCCVRLVLPVCDRYCTYAIECVCMRGSVNKCAQVGVSMCKHTRVSTSYCMSRVAVVRVRLGAQGVPLTSPPSQGAASQCKSPNVRVETPYVQRTEC